LKQYEDKMTILKANFGQNVDTLVENINT